MSHPDRPIAFVLAATHHGSMIVNRNDYRMTDATSGIGVGYQLLSKSAFDPHEVSMVLALLDQRRKHFHAGVVALDAGANIGVHTLEWARHMHGWGSVTAIEAQERLFYALAGNIALNNCFNARAIWAALGDRCGELPVPQPDYLRPASFGSLELKHAPSNEDIGQPVSYQPQHMSPVRAITVDSLALARLDFVKIDIEGMEAEALRGARQTLQRCRPILMVEAIKSSREALVALLEELGYRVHDLGMNLLALHRSDPAEVSIRRDAARMEVTIASNDVMSDLESVLRGARSLHRDGKAREAIPAYERVLQMAPDHHDALWMLVVAHLDVSEPEKALAIVDNALKRGRTPPLLVSRGRALYDLGDFQAALECYEEALAMQPDYIDGLFHRGRVLERLDRPAQAIADLDRVIAAAPGYGVAFHNRGMARQALGDLRGAFADFDEALRLDPHYEETQLARAMARLQVGDFEKGWASYECRLPVKAVLMRRPTEPLWDGKASLRGKTLLLLAEQGFGDTLQFCRYAALLERRGAKVLLEVPGPLVELLKPLKGVAGVFPYGAPLPPVDFWCPLLSVPGRVGTNADTIPSPGRYLKAPRERLVGWRKSLGESEQPRVALAWSGSAKHRNDLRRTLTLAQLLPWLPEGIEYVSVQKELRTSDVRVLAGTPRIRNLAPQLHDFADTAAVCELCDAVVSIDTALVHLAGALMRPTFVLLPFNPDWRWQLGREDSPWYPSLRLLRQDAPGDWESVFLKLAALLESTASKSDRRRARKQPA